MKAMAYWLLKTEPDEYSWNDHLKRGAKDKSEAEVDTILNNGILLLQYLANKDTFETYYKRHMAKRLLMKKSVSKEMERQMLSKMKMKIGKRREMILSHC